MSERFLPSDDPVLEAVHQWTVERDAQDVRRLLERALDGLDEMA
jgi:hypothetical protein